MTDLHTHILPGMDDGAGTVDESLALLRMEWQQGVDAVVLTPHFYRDRENPRHFLRRRQEAAMVLEERIMGLPEEERAALPQRILGAEVAWAPNLADWEEISRLCIGNTKNLLLEMPFIQWDERIINGLYDFIGRTGITPVIAHLERYLKLQRPERIQDMLSLGVPVQISGAVLLQVLGRGPAIKMLRKRKTFLLASDCHSCGRRPPNLAAATEVVRRKLGDDSAERLIAVAKELAGLSP